MAEGGGRWDAKKLHQSFPYSEKISLSMIPFTEQEEKAGFCFSILGGLSEADLHLYTENQAIRPHSLSQTPHMACYSLLLFQLLLWQPANQLCMGVTWQHLALLCMWFLGICWNLLSHSDASAHLGVKKSLDKYCPLSCLGGTIPTCMLPGSSEGSEQDWGPFAHSSDQKASPASQLSSSQTRTLGP